MELEVIALELDELELVDLEVIALESEELEMVDLALEL